MHWNFVIIVLLIHRHVASISWFPWFKTYGFQSSLLLLCNKSMQHLGNLQNQLLCILLLLLLLCLFIYFFLCFLLSSFGLQSHPFNFNAVLATSLALHCWLSSNFINFAQITSILLWVLFPPFPPFNTFSYAWKIKNSPDICESPCIQDSAKMTG